MGNNFLYFKLGNVPIWPTKNKWMNTCPSYSSEPIRPLDVFLSVPVILPETIIIVNAKPFIFAL